MGFYTRATDTLTLANVSVTVAVGDIYRRVALSPPTEGA
jgi:hypothetical protein